MRQKSDFKNKSPSLTLVNLDIASNLTQKLTSANLIWAALIFEYADMVKCFEFISGNVKGNGFLIATIQGNNGASSIKPDRGGNN